MIIEAMKQALEALEGWANYGKWVWPETALEQAKRNTYEAITTLRAAIKEAEKQEPVAWMYHGIRHDNTPHERPSLIWKPEYMDAMSAEKGVKAIPLYTAPPPRQWQDLTDKEMWDMYYALPYESYSDTMPIARAVQAKLKELNT